MASNMDTTSNTAALPTSDTTPNPSADISNKRSPPAGGALPPHAKDLRSNSDSSDGGADAFHRAKKQVQEAVEESLTDKFEDKFAKMLSTHNEDTQKAVAMQLATQRKDFDGKLMSHGKIITAETEEKIKVAQSEVITHNSKMVKEKIAAAEAKTDVKFDTMEAKFMQMFADAAHREDTC